MKFFFCYILHFYDTFSSTFNNQSFTKSRRALLLYTELLGKKEERKIKKYFSYFSWKIESDISCKLYPLETICMKCQILFKGKIRKNLINLSSAESAYCVVSKNFQMSVRAKRSAIKLCFS